MTDTVLILTHPDDAHADAVQPHLLNLGLGVHRLDTAALSNGACLTVRLGAPALSGDIDGLPISDVRSVWYRRPTPVTTYDPIDTAELTAASTVLAALPHLNHPGDMATAASKPYQLALAARLGLTVPDTLVTNRLRAAEAMAINHDVVIKPMRRTTDPITAGDTSGWQRAAHLTQRLIPKTCDVRVTAIDGELFCVRIQGPALDWRTHPEACSFTLIDAPPETAARIRAFLEAVHLRSASLDFAVTDDGLWWFLDLTPDGNWLWIARETGAPLAQRVAAALARDVTPPGF